MQRFFSDDIAGLFAQIGDRQRSMTPQSNVQAPSFVPRVDVVQRGSELVVRTDLPGMSPDDVVVEVGDDSIIISGERQQEDAADNGGIYRFERTYGAFVREIPLPKGADVDRATATFKDGVLEITVPAPSQQDSRGRRLQINRGENTKNDDADKNARPNP
jgi:HSP20 family protein